MITLLPSDYIKQESRSEGVPLEETISCSITEELNGAYELEMSYPQSGIAAKKISVGLILAVTIQSTTTYITDDDPNATWSSAVDQLFRIYKIETTLSDQVLKIYASHISYDLNYIWVTPYSASNTSQALSGIKDNWLTVGTKGPWTFGRIIATVSTPFYNTEYRTVKNVLYGDSNSILDVYGGEYILDNFKCILVKERGHNRGFFIRSGSNLIEMNQDADIDNMFTHAFSYYIDPSSGQYLRGGVRAINGSNFPVGRIQGIDAAQFFDSIPTSAQLDALTDLMSVGLSTDPSFTFDIKYADLVDLIPKDTQRHQRTSNYDISLGDTITIVYDGLEANFGNVGVTARVLKIVYDAVTERIDTVSVGRVKKAKSFVAVRPDITTSIVTDQHKDKGRYETLTKFTNDEVAAARADATAEVGNLDTVLRGFINDKSDETIAAAQAFTTQEVTAATESTTAKIEDLQEETSAQIESVNIFASDSINQITNDISTINEYLDKNDANYTQLKSSLDSIDQTVNDLVLNFTEVIERNTGDLEEIKKYIRFENGNIILGASNSKITLTIANEDITFTDNTTDLDTSVWENTTFNAVDGIFRRSLTLGNFAFVPNSNGNLSFKKVKGD